MKYKLVIFDLDGTILNTLRDLMEACNFALKKFHLPLISLEQTQRYIGHGIRNLLLSASNYSPQIDQIVKVFKSYYAIHYNDYTKKYAGIEDVFSFCRKKNIIIGVLTNKVEDIAKNLIEAHFPKTFDFVYGEVEGRARKPNPSFLLSILKQYGCRKEEALYIGDSEVDIEVCKNACIDGVFVAYGFRRKEILSGLTKCIIDTPKELLKYMKEE